MTVTIHLLKPATINGVTASRFPPKPDDENWKVMFEEYGAEVWHKTGVDLVKWSNILRVEGIGR